MLPDTTSSGFRTIYKDPSFNGFNEEDYIYIIESSKPPPDPTVSTTNDQVESSANSSPEKTKNQGISNPNLTQPHTPNFNETVRKLVMDSWIKKKRTDLPNKRQKKQVAKSEEEKIKNVKLKPV